MHNGIQTITRKKEQQLFSPFLCVCVCVCITFLVKYSESVSSEETKLSFSWDVVKENGNIIIYKSPGIGHMKYDDGGAIRKN